MKKLLSLLLALAMILAIMPAALAEETAEVQPKAIDVMGNFTITCEIPEGYSYEDEYVSDLVYTGILYPADVTKPLGVIVIAYNEEADGRSLSDLSEEEIQAHIAEEKAQMGQDVIFSDGVTDYGTRILGYLVKDPEENRLEVYTLYMGYEVSFALLPPQGGTVTEEDFEFVRKFISEVWINR